MRLRSIKVLVRLRFQTLTIEFFNFRISAHCLRSTGMLGMYSCRLRERLVDPEGLHSSDITRKEMLR